MLSSKFEHTPPLKQGLDKHGSIGTKIKKMRPVHPALIKPNYILILTFYELNLGQHELVMGLLCNRCTIKFD